MARTEATGGGSAGRCRSGEDLCRAEVGRTARGSLDTGDLCHGCARRGAYGRKAGKRSHLRLLPPRAADYRGGGSTLLSATNQHPLPNACEFPFRSSGEHLLRALATALGRSILANGTPNDAAGGSIGRGRCRCPWLRSIAPLLTRFQPRSRLRGAPTGEADQGCSRPRDLSARAGARVFLAPRTS